MHICIAYCVVIYLFSTFCEELVPPLNTFLTYSTLTVCHFQHFRCFWALNFIFYTKFYAYSLIYFFRQQKIANSRKTLLTFMPFTTNKKCYIAETVNIHSGKVCQHRKKNRKSNVHSPRNLKIHQIFLTDLVCVCIIPFNRLAAGKFQYKSTSYKMQNAYKKSLDISGRVPDLNAGRYID